MINFTVTTANPTTTPTANGMSDDSGIFESTVGVAVITFTVTFILTLTATAIITFVVTYLCVKKPSEKNKNPSNKLPQEKVIYEQVGLPRHTVTEDDVELQPNPTYGTGHRMIVDSNPTCESYK